MHHGGALTLWRLRGADVKGADDVERLEPPCHNADESSCREPSVRHLERDIQRIREARDPLVGKYLDGRFHVLRWIGRGAYSNVYLAADTKHHDRYVAVKVIRKAQAEHARAYTGTSSNPFAHELHFNRLLRNPAVTRVIHAGQTDQGIDYIAMEYVDGANLDRLTLTEGPLEVPAIVQLADQLLAYAQECHDNGFAHRDLKPDNIVVKQLSGGMYRFKVLDLGQARFFRDVRPDRETVVGTPAFVAPEVAAGEPVTPRAEVYACGTILYQAATGYHAIELERPSTEGFYAYLRDASKPIPVVPVLDHRPDFPVRLAGAIEWALRRNPDERPASAALLRQAILRVAEEDGLMTPPEDREGLLGRVQRAWRDLLGGSRKRRSRS